MDRAIEVVCALLIRDGCLLMGERSPHKVYPLHWEFPGGKIEPGETPFEALRRELQEELAIEIDSAQAWMRETNTYSNGMTYDVRYFLVQDWSGEMVTLEFNRIQWVTQDVLSTLHHLSGNKNILDRLANEGIPAWHPPS